MTDFLLFCGLPSLIGAMVALLVRWQMRHCWPGRKKRLIAEQSNAEDTQPIESWPMLHQPRYRDERAWLNGTPYFKLEDEPDSTTARLN